LTANIGVARHIVLGGFLYQGRRAFQIFRVGLFAIRMVKENSVGSSDGGFASAERVPGEPDARGGIYESCRHTAPSDSCRATLYHAVERRFSSRRDERTFLTGDVTGYINVRSSLGIVSRRIPVVHLFAAVVVGPKETQPQSKIQGEILRDVE